MAPSSAESVVGGTPIHRTTGGCGGGHLKLQIVLVPYTEAVSARPIDAHRVQERMHLLCDLVFPDGPEHVLADMSEVPSFGP